MDIVTSSTSNMLGMPAMHTKGKKKKTTKKQQHTMVFYSLEDKKLQQLVDVVAVRCDLHLEAIVPRAVPF